jgi:[acyl-carrier-protein] S-malonyltransferase
MSKIAFLFPGQGAQFVGMGRALYDALPAARSLFDQAKAVLGYELSEVCFNGPEDRLQATDVSQPAIFVASLAALESLKAQEPGVVDQVAAAAGLSLGEYTALTFAGAMSFTDGLALVKKRGEAMQAAAVATPSGMISVLGLEADKVEEVCSKARAAGRVQIANLLGPGNIVVSGEKAALDVLEPLATEAGAMKTIRLSVAGAFHTELMKPADQQLAAALDKVELKAPRLPVWSNVDARPHTEPADIRGLLVRQVLQPVLWEQTIRAMLADGFDKFYEIGPGRVLAGLLKRIHRKTECVNVQA